MGWHLLLLLVLCCRLLQLACLEPSPILRAPSGIEKTGCFVVVLKKESNDSKFEAIQSKLVDLSTDSRLYGSVRNVAKAITVALNDSTLDMVSWSLMFVQVVKEDFYRSELLLMWSILRRKL